jgi:hypothetical protein
MFDRFKIRKFNNCYCCFCVDKWYIVDSYVRLLTFHFLHTEIDIPYIWFGKPAIEIKK